MDKAKDRRVSNASTSIEEHEIYEACPVTAKPTLHRVKSYASSYAAGAEGYTEAALTRQATAVSTRSVAKDPDFEVDFDEGDQGNAREWATWKKGLALAAMSYGTTTL